MFTCHHHTTSTHRNDTAFLGVTHALSVIVILTITGLGLTLLGQSLGGWLASLAGTAQPATAITAAFVFATLGGATLPDLDHESSSAKTALGPLGTVLSALMRTSSVLAQTTVRTTQDDPNPTGQRGLWHTAIGAGVTTATLSGAIALFSQVGWLPGGFALSTWFTAAVLAILTYLGLYALAILFLLRPASSTTTPAPASVGGDGGARTASWRAKSTVPITWRVVIGIIGTALSVNVMLVTPPGVGYVVALGAGVGMFLHAFGDTFTPLGAPVWAGFCRLWRPKLWWNTRFAKIETGSDREYLYVTFPLAASSGAILLALMSWFLFFT